jgi:hypothetical protein
MPDNVLAQIHPSLAAYTGYGSPDYLTVMNSMLTFEPMMEPTVLSCGRVTVGNLVQP